jgi:hypothetical protein
MVRPHSQLRAEHGAMAWEDHAGRKQLPSIRRMSELVEELHTLWKRRILTVDPNRSES